MVSLVFYLLTLYHVWYVCQYGNLRGHLPAILSGILAMVIFLLIGLKGKRTRGSKSIVKEDTANDNNASIDINMISETTNDVKASTDSQADSSHPASKTNWGKSVFQIEMIIFIGATLFFGGRIIYAAIPYNGALSWKIEDLWHKKEIPLKHTNLFNDGVEGMLKDLDDALDLPKDLYISDKYQVTFDSTGTIQTIDTFIYGKNEKGVQKTYLVSYDNSKSDQMTVWLDGYADGNHEEDMRLAPLTDILSRANWQQQVETWSESLQANTSQPVTYELLYAGRRSFVSAEGLQYVAGPSSNQANQGQAIDSLKNGGQLVGYEVSLAVPDETTVIPVRYIMDPEYISQTTLNEEKTKQQVVEAKNEDGWTTDDTDGTMSFFLDDQVGWHLIVTDAAAGSRFYALEGTTDGGQTWNSVNEDPFKGEIGVAAGLAFLDQTIGFIDLTGASQSSSVLLMTTDGGQTFKTVELPMNTVTALPTTAKGNGLTLADYDYVSMPVKDDDTLTVTVTSEAAETDGIVFQSIDNGITWQYSGVTQ